VVETETANKHLSMRDFISDSNESYELQEETWLDSITAVKLKAEHDEALSLRVSIKADLEKIKCQVCLFSLFLTDIIAILTA